jgi:hypothetical protein
MRHELDRFQEWNAAVQAENASLKARIEEVDRAWHGMRERNASFDAENAALKTSTEDARSCADRYAAEKSQALEENRQLTAQLEQQRLEIANLRLWVGQLSQECAVERTRSKELAWSKSAEHLRANSLFQEKEEQRLRAEALQFYRESERRRIA